MEFDANLDVLQADLSPPPGHERTDARLLVDGIDPEANEPAIWLEGKHGAK